MCTTFQAMSKAIKTLLFTLLQHLYLFRVSTIKNVKRLLCGITAEWNIKIFNHFSYLIRCKIALIALIRGKVSRE